MSFLETGTVIFFNLFGQIISPPSIWTEFDPMNMTQFLVDITYRTAVTPEYFGDLYNRSANTDTLRYVQILDQYYQNAEYYESTVLLPYNFIETTVNLQIVSFLHFSHFPQFSHFLHFFFFCIF